MTAKKHTVPNSKIGADRKKRPVVHILRYDEGTNAMRALAVAVPENPLDGDESRIYCLLINGKGKVVVDSVTRRPVVLEAPPLVMSLLEEPDRMMSRREVSGLTGLSVQTIKRAERAGELSKVKLSERRVGYPAHVIDDWVASRNAKRRA